MYWAMLASHDRPRRLYVQEVEHGAVVVAVEHRGQMNTTLGET